MKRTRQQAFGTPSAFRTFRSARTAMVRTGGNYNQVRKRRNPRTGRYLVGSGPERKFVDTVLGNVTTSTLSIGTNSAGDSGTPTLVPGQLLNGLLQGTDSTTRIGRKIIMTSIQGRITLTCQNNAAGAIPAGTLGGQVRLIVFMDNQTNGLIPALSDVMLNATNQFIQSPYNLNNRERFRVLYDKIRMIDPQNQQSCYFKLYKKLNAPVIFNAGNAGTVADIQTGSIYFAIGTNVQSTIGSTCDGTAIWRIRFKDD